MPTGVCHWPVLSSNVCSIEIDIVCHLINARLFNIMQLCNALRSMLMWELAYQKRWTHLKYSKLYIGQLSIELIICGFRCRLKCNLYANPRTICNVFQPWWWMWGSDETVYLINMIYVVWVVFVTIFRLLVFFSFDIDLISQLNK